MNTIGWLFILTAGLALSAISRGRVMELKDDLGDAFLALVQGNAAGLQEVLSRTGDGTTSTTATADPGGDVPTPTGADPGGKEYKLGNVKAHVRAAANSIGHQFHVNTIYGIGPGSVPNSDHPKGLALDFMINSRAQGDAISQYVIDHQQALGMKYVIWYKRIWQGGEWKPYHGPRDHTDHVHVSFYPKNSVPFVGPTNKIPFVGPVQ